jgi:hypothetical protein
LWDDRRVLQFPQRLLAALPDAITTAVFLTAWVTPTHFGLDHVRDFTLLLLAPDFAVG